MRVAKLKKIYDIYTLKKKYAIIDKTYESKELKMSLDLFTVQTFPNHEQQKDIIENYFDTQSLWIDIKKYCKNNNIPENIVVHGLDGFFEEANQDFREKVRRFNNLYLTVELLRFANYYKLWQECKEKEYKQHLSIWYRY